VPRELDQLVEDPDPERARRAMEAMLKMGKIEGDELRRAVGAPGTHSWWDSCQFLSVGWGTM
jgi:hypothetical protein